MDTVENNFYSKTWTIYISIQYIFKHDLDMLQGKFKLVKTLVVFFFLSTQRCCGGSKLIDLIPCIKKSLSSTKLTDNVTSTEKRHPAI